MDTAAIREHCQHLARRLERHLQGGEAHGIYLELAPLLGQLQGAVTEAIRAQGTTEETEQARLALERFKAGMRRVGLDIRLASQSALVMGLQASLESALETLDCLQWAEEKRGRDA